MKNLIVSRFTFSSMNLMLIVLPSFFLLFVLTCALQPVNGQNNITASFTPYQNPSLGFSIQHPSDWQLDEDTSGKFKVVRFNAPDGSNPMFVVSVEDTAPYLDTDTMTLKNTTLEQSVQQKLNFFKTFSLESNLDFKLIRQNDITVGGNPGTKIEYS